jgi:hypothetical protein
VRADYRGGSGVPGVLPGRVGACIGPDYLKERSIE